MDRKRPKEDGTTSAPSLPGTAGLLFLTLVGLILLFAPLVASEFEGDRDTAIQLLLRALPAGALVGIVAGMAAGRTRHDNGSGWGKNLSLFANAPPAEDGPHDSRKVNPVEPIELPPELEALYSWLEGEGFKCKEDVPYPMGSRRIVMKRGRWRVELLADRSEWSLGISFSHGEWIHPDVWEAYLDDVPLAGELSDLEHQVRFLQTRFPEIDSAARWGVERKLKKMGEEYMRRQLGIGPPK